MTIIKPHSVLDAAKVASCLRETFRTGRTRPSNWRLEQLHAIVKLIEENEDEICRALFADLHKPRHEALTMEVCYAFSPTLRRHIISFIYT